MSADYQAGEQAPPPYLTNQLFNGPVAGPPPPPLPPPPLPPSPLARECVCMSKMCVWKWVHM